MSLETQKSGSFQVGRVTSSFSKWKGVSQAWETFLVFLRGDQKSVEQERKV